MILKAFANSFKIPELKRHSDDYKGFAKELGIETTPEEKLTIRKKDLAELKGITFVTLKV